MQVTSKQARCCLVVLAVLAPCAAGAQTTTADGVQALIRGDYAAAVRILRPLAEDTPQPDPLAAFFLATLYHSGRGVVFNDIRACGLYLTAATPANPLLSQALALAQAIHMDQPAIRDLCSAASTSWRDPPAASFTLGPNHSVRIDHEGFVVTYKGTQKQAVMTMGGPGWVYLPTRHTPLEVSHPVAVRRHFIEFFTWMPPFLDQPWSLVWSVYEVVGGEALPVHGQGNLVTTVLATIAAAQPPASFAVEDVARIRVNADGEAEWVVSGANPRSAVIPYTELR